MASTGRTTPVDARERQRSPRRDETQSLVKHRSPSSSGSSAPRVPASPRDHEISQARKIKNLEAQLALARVQKGKYEDDVNDNDDDDDLQMAVQASMETGVPLPSETTTTTNAREQALREKELFVNESGRRVVEGAYQATELIQQAQQAEASAAASRAETAQAELQVQRQRLNVQSTMDSAEAQHASAQDAMN